MGFVAKLFGVFVPIMVAMIFYHQRDHILGEEKNAIFEAQLTKFSEQLNYHLDSIVDQLNSFVGESKAIVGEEPKENEIPNDEIDLKEKYRKAKESEELAKQQKDRQNDRQPTKQSTDLPTNKCELGKDLLITKEQLARYNGEDAMKKIYLSFLGIVYDVSWFIKFPKLKHNF